MRVTFDEAANAAYIYVVNKIDRGEVAETRVCSTPIVATSVSVDFNSDGRLLGIELLGVKKLLAPEAVEGLRDS